MNEGIRKRLQIIFSGSKRRAEEEIRERLVEMGLTEDMAKNAAEKIAQDKNSIKSLVPREESSELRAAVYTGLAYIMGVFFPVILYFLTSTIYIALPLSVIFAGLTLAIVSTIISIISGISVRKKVAEMIILGLGAAGLSYLVGSLMNLLFGAAFT
ncbi:MAG: VIT1/CCC1 transporter family protein [Thermoplasmata archaeon]|nr:VIT1/CCC1 transporter family protein [Thermoplasmata archaeon]